MVFRDLIRAPRIRENYQGKYLNVYCNQYCEMVIMDALLCIIHKTHCMRLLIRGVDNMRFLFSSQGKNLKT